MTEPMYIFHQSGLPKLGLNVDRETDFAVWDMQWDSYCFLSGFVNELCLARETLAVVHNLGLSEAQIKKLSAIIEAMQTYMDGYINETMECHKFCR